MDYHPGFFIFMKDFIQLKKKERGFMLAIQFYNQTLHAQTPVRAVGVDA